MVVVVVVAFFDSALRVFSPARKAPNTEDPHTEEGERRKRADGR
jgi:hypothetical protein